jgi:phage terminase large subunit-like protein
MSSGLVGKPDIPVVTAPKPSKSRKDLGGEAIPGLADISRIGEFIEVLSRGTLTNPRHFAAFCDVYERAHRGGLRVCLVGPRQHGKTTLGEYALAWHALRDPRIKLFFATYAQDYTEKQSRVMRRVQLDAGVRFQDDHLRLDGWSFESGGYQACSSIGGPANGLGSNIAIVDDAFKSEQDAASLATRDKAYDFVKSTVVPMLAPGGSLIVTASRMHEDDLIGRLVRLDGFDQIRIPAINDGVDLTRSVGEALCPWGPDPKYPRTLEFLTDLRDGKMSPSGVRQGALSARTWMSQYQGLPPPPEDSMFREPKIVDGFVPHKAECIGVDLAFSRGKGTDYACLIHASMTAAGVMQIHDVWRGKMVTQEYMPALLAWKARHPGLSFYSYSSGPEKGVIIMAHLEGIPIFPIDTGGRSKATRAQKAAYAWNDGRVVLPRNAPWLDTFRREVCNFDGSGSDNDDQVDAMVSAYDMLAGVTMSTSFFTGGSRCV